MEANLINLAIALATFMAAIASWRSSNASKRAATETQQMSHAQLMSTLLDAYASEEMLDAIEALKDWFKKDGERTAAEEFHRLRQDKPNDADVKRIERARRRVSHFFQ